jgi:hypothetical protein
MIVKNSIEGRGTEWMKVTSMRILGFVKPEFHDYLHDYSSYENAIYINSPL